MVRYLFPMVLIAGVVALAILGRDQLFPAAPSPTRRVIALNDLKAFTTLDAGSLGITIQASPEAVVKQTAVPTAAEDLQLDVLNGRLTLRHIPKGAVIDPAADVGPMATNIIGHRVMVLSVSDPMALLRAGDTVDLVLVPFSTRGTPSTGPPTNWLNEVVNNAFIVEIEDASEGDSRSALVALPPGQEPRRSVGRTLAYPVYTVGE